ncbi:MAG: hypothetical protein EP343_04060 [Deltaproteobacteria bacterium]|nr:MAG: hypothetical protein EP343_04060 [Deltaproteobacteria bacterium]
MNPWDISSLPPHEHWAKLYQDGEVVGFRRKVGRALFFSDDGYIWSGKPIPFDNEYPETGLRDRTDVRVFDGDCVMLSGLSGDRSPQAFVILHHPEAGALCWSPDQDWFQPVSKLWPGPRRPVATKVIGHIHNTPSLVERAQRIVASYSLNQTAPLSDVIGLSIAMLLAVVVIVAVQIMAWGSVGPLSTALGPVLGAVPFFVRSYRTNPFWMTRDRLVSLAKRTGLVWFVLCGLAYASALTWGGDGFAEARRNPVAISVIIAFLGSLLTFVVTLLSGDSVKWLFQKPDPHSRRRS